MPNLKRMYKVYTRCIVPVITFFRFRGMLPANELSRSLNCFDFWHFLHTTAQHSSSSSTARFICHRCARGLHCPPSTANRHQVRRGRRRRDLLLRRGSRRRGDRRPGFRRHRGLLRSARKCQRSRCLHSARSCDA